MKTIKKNNKWKIKYWKYLLWLSPVLIVMGLSAGVVAGSWEPVPLILIIAGSGCLGLWLVLETASGEGFWGKRSTQASTNALTATLSVLIILGLINFLATRYLVRVDLTENQQYTLAPQTQQIVRNLRKPVKVWVFERGVNNADKELLESYRRISGNKFSYEFVDPQEKPALAGQFEVKNFGDVFLESGERRQFLINVSPQTRLREVTLTNGIAKIQSERQAKVYFLQGHGEHSITPGEGGLSQAVKALENKNFISEPLNLAEKSAVPPDADVVVIAGPKRALFEGEVNALKKYLNEGGSLLVMIDPKTDPKLDSLLNEWGVTVENRLVIDASGTGQLVGLGPAVPLISEYGDHPITKDFDKGYSYYPGARSLITKPVEGIKETPLLITNERSWAESSPDKPPLKFDKNSDRQGPLLLGVALSRNITSDTAKQSEAKPTPTVTPTQKADNPTPTPTVSETTKPEATATPTTPPQKKPDQKTLEARMVVIGNSTFATDGLFDQQLNGDVFLNSISWLSRQDDTAISIRPKEPTNRRINISTEQARLVGWLSIGILPLIGLGTAGILWWIRR
ncbi:MAG: Gldg family protein [Oscillatoriaceae bacterium SKW80]|nr:Gldg family protein [Oscillatoriaceae bacterium SKYG93]MCX8121426.1 Gldg family protein [Oscillatoriaceae bacterium SKW80]MDW8451897.1 Gldg family protein [Oscillatoriaceae cyanobacterium SKYGB_i_bin93]HIK29440.1 Gldg family protein [Oscillatoriaceae cyanobacterium M7585_C2015_266]